MLKAGESCLRITTFFRLFLHPTKSSFRFLTVYYFVAIANIQWLALFVRRHVNRPWLTLGPDLYVVHPLATVDLHDRLRHLFFHLVWNYVHAHFSSPCFRFRKTSQLSTKSSFDHVPLVSASSCQGGLNSRLFFVCRG